MSNTNNLHGTIYLINQSLDNTDKKYLGELFITLIEEYKSLRRAYEEGRVGIIGYRSQLVLIKRILEENKDLEYYGITVRELNIEIHKYYLL